MNKMIKVKKSKFLQVACPRCNNKQIVFGKSVSLVKCIKCNYLLLKTNGGKSKIRAPVKDIFS